MDIKIDGFYIDKPEYYKMSLDIRYEIFVEELGFEKHLEFDGKDKNATHYIVLYDSKVIGCARLIEDLDKLRIDRFGILKPFRGWGFGLLLMKFILREISVVKKKIEWLSTTESLVFFIQQGLKDSNDLENFNDKKVRILYL
jgi:predicted GNAT family N-acyltransferase